MSQEEFANLVAQMRIYQLLSAQTSRPDVWERKELLELIVDAITTDIINANKKSPVL